MNKEILQLVDVRTTSGRGKYKCDQINFQICESDIAGILFDSVFDRNSFLKCIKGESELLSGKIFLREKLISYTEFKRKANETIEVLGTDTCLIPTLDMIDNIFLKDYSPYVTKNERKDKYETIVEKFGISIPKRKEINELSFLEIVLLKMAKAYVDKKKLIIFNNISGNMNHSDIDEIYSFVKKLQSNNIAFIIIESVDDAMLKWSDYIYYINKSKTVGILNDPTRDLSLFRSRYYKNCSKKNIDPNPIVIEDFIPDSDSALLMQKVYYNSIKDLSIILGKGESLCLFFNDQKNISDFISIFSNSKVMSGRVYIEGVPIYSFPKKGLLQNGIAMINSSQGNSELMFNMSVMDNLGIILANKMKGVWDGKKYLNSINLFIEQYIGKDISHQKVQDLEPEHIIKLIYARWLLYRPKLLFIYNPLVEIDLNLQQTVIDMIHLLNENKISVVLLLSNMSSLEKFNIKKVYINDDMNVE